ncbi:PAAR domain-containing protein [Dryocola clanedunensis]
MAKGYILHMNDPTTCGGRVLEGAPNRRTNGISVARMGDTVTCGKDGKAYRIVGGISWITTDGRPVAGSLDSISSCPCNARFIPQITVQSYESRSRSESLASPHLAFAEFAGSASLTTFEQTEPEQHAQTAKKKNSFADTCKPEDNELLNGVYIWTETKNAGHAFVSVHENNNVYLYTYDSLSPYSGGTVGGVLGGSYGDDEQN